MSQKKVIATEKAPNAIGPYSQGVESKNGFLFLSGQAPLEPSTGTLTEGTIKDKTHRVMKNLQAILEEAGLTFNNVVKTTIFCTDLANFKDINEVYGSYFEKPYPARSTVQVAALPLGIEVEIEMIAER